MPTSYNPYTLPRISYHILSLLPCLISRVHSSRPTDPAACASAAMHHLHAPVLSLTPDSLASLGDLDGDSLSELWGGKLARRVVLRRESADPLARLPLCPVFTKCKDSLQNGRRLENLSWRLWFDSGRRQQQLHQDQQVAAAAAAANGISVSDSRDAGWSGPLLAVDQEGWSDPEWTEATDSDTEEDEVATQVTAASKSESTRPCPPAKQRTSSTNAEASLRPLLKDWRTSSTISGGSIQRILSSAPISLPPKAQSVATPGHHIHEPLLSPGLGLTSRHSSAPEQLLESAPIAFTSPPLAPVPPSPRKWVDARTQTTPSNSHRPSPKIPPAILTMSPTPPATVASSSALSAAASMSTAVASSSTSRSMVRSSSTTSSNQLPQPRRSSNAKAGARRHSSPKPPPPTPATSVTIQTRTGTATQTGPASVTSPASNPTFEPKSFVKGFDTSIIESRPQNGSIAPPPTPAAALSSLPPASPPKRRPLPGVSSTLSRSALKSPTLAPTSELDADQQIANTTKPKAAHPAPSKKIFFISSPNSDSEDDASSSRSRGASIGQYLPEAKVSAGGKKRSSSLSAQVEVANEATKVDKSPANMQGEDEEWSDDDDDAAAEEHDRDDGDSSSGWGSEYSSESSARARNAREQRERTDVETKGGLFAKRPSERALDAPISELKPRPPGLLSQLFHPDLFIDDADRRHSTVDVTRSNGRLTAFGTGTAGSSSTMLTTSKSAGLLSEQNRSKSFLRGRPDDVELESSSDEEDGQGAGDAGARGHAVAAALSRQQERQRLETLQPIAPPQTPRTTRRAMLATELSESLRRNLLWERQTRNRVMGGVGPVNRVSAAQARGTQPQQQPRQAFPNATAPPQPTASTSGATATAEPGAAARVQSDTGLVLTGAAAAASAAAAAVGQTPAPPPKHQPKQPSLDSGLHAPDTSAATRSDSPPHRTHQHHQPHHHHYQHAPTRAAAKTLTAGSGEMVRRHTTGTGLYLAAQRGKLSKHHHKPRGARNTNDGDGSSCSESSSGESTDSDLSTSDESEVGVAAGAAEAQRRPGSSRGYTQSAAAGPGDGGGGDVGVRRVKSGLKKKDMFGDVWGQRVW